MIKFIIIVFIVYVLYYAINIAYDLFFKKDFSDEKIIEEHTFDHVKTVSIVDEENVYVSEDSVEKHLIRSLKSEEQNLVEAKESKRSLIVV